jgi:hypothetical protein
MANVSRARPILVVGAVVVAAVATLASCAGADVPRPSPAATSRPTPASPSQTPMPPGTASPTPEPSIDLPRDAPTTFADDVSVDELPRHAVLPPGATETASHVLDGDGEGPDTLALAWARRDDPLAAERGLVIWQRFPQRPAWRAVYAFTDPPERGVLGIRLEPGDVTGDGVDDLLSFEDIGGSGGCGTWRVVVTAEPGAAEVWRRRGCDTQVRLSRGRVEVREAVFEPGDAHCCPSAYRISRLAWDGETLTEVRSTVSPAPDAG